MFERLQNSLGKMIDFELLGALVGPGAPSALRVICRLFGSSWACARTGISAPKSFRHVRVGLESSTHGNSCRRRQIFAAMRVESISAAAMPEGNVPKHNVASLPWIFD